VYVYHFRMCSAFLARLVIIDFIDMLTFREEHIIKLLIIQFSLLLCYLLSHRSLYSTFLVAFLSNARDTELFVLF
jgi:hypothetical protein